MSTGRITLYVAASVDGFIAAPDGGVEWLDEYQRETRGADAAADGAGSEPGGYDEFFATVECLVMGSTTYEQVRSFGAWPYGETPTYVLTRRKRERASDAVEFVEGDVDVLATRLCDEYDHVWLIGGADVARAFLRAGRVDELRLSLIPVLLGRGIPLFGDDDERRGLRLLASTTRETGVVELRYAVEA